MADPFEYDPFSFYKYSFQQQQEESEEPTSVLEVVYSSPSPSPSLQLSPSDNHSDDALLGLLYKRSEYVPNEHVLCNEYVPNTSPLSLADLDSLLNMDLPQDMDIDAILPAVYETVTVEHSVFQAYSSSSSLDGSHFAANNCVYEGGTDLDNYLLRFGCDELPPLNNYGWSDLLDMEHQQHQSSEMSLESITDPGYERQIERYSGDPKTIYGELLQMEHFGDQDSFLTQMGRIENAPTSPIEPPPFEFESSCSGLPVFSLETSERSLTNPVKRSLSGMAGVEDGCPQLPSMMTRKMICIEDESSLMPALNRKLEARELTSNEDVMREQKPYGRTQLLEKLVACAQAVACHDNRQGEMTLREIETMISPYGDPLQRVASCFTEGLRARLGVSTSAHLQQEGLERIVCEGCPFIPFGHFATNSMILEATEGEEFIHVVDLGMELGLQWPALIQSLGYKASGRPRLLRVTGVGASIEKMQVAKQEMEKAANWVKLPFEFQAVIVQNSLENLKKGMLDLKAGEAVVVNGALQFHGLLKESRRGLSSLLKLVHDIAPKILTVVEQEGNHNGPFFLGRFNEALQYYTAIFESLEVTMSRCSSKRAKIEQCYFGEQIKNIVSCEGPARVERHERLDQWRRRMGRAGFQPFCFNLLSLKARIWLARYDYCDDYSLTEEKGSLVLGWKGRPIIAASAWRCS